MITIKYTLSEGGVIHFYKKRRESYKYLFGVYGNEGRFHYEEEALDKRPLIKLDKHIYVNTVIFMDGQRVLGRLFATKNGIEGHKE